MNAKKICGLVCGVPDNRYLDLGLLLVRLVLGFAFVFHGWAKVSDINGAVAMLGSMGVTPIWTYIAAYTEFLGGLCLMLGVATRLAGHMLAIFMIVAIYLVHLSHGYNSMMGGYEYQLLLLAGAIFFAHIGPGKYSVHNNWCKKHN